jgi:hypothetical protein
MSILADDSTNDNGADNDAVAALVASMVPSKAPKEDESEPEDDEADLDEEAQDDDPEDDEGEDEEADDDGEDDDGGEEPQADKVPEVTDDTVVKVLVNGEEQEFSVGSLKRLAGQEASLTQKSQEADIVGQRAAATLQGALEAVMEDLAGYQDVDWVLEGSRMDPEEFAWHRGQHGKLTQRYNALVKNAQELEKTVKARQAADLERDANECNRVLSDPKTGIEGWSAQLHGEIVKYAVSAGLPEDDVNTIVNPEVIKIINKARLFDEGQKAAAKKVNLTPQRVRRVSGSDPVPVKADKAQRRLEAKVKAGQGSDNDAIALLLGRWGAGRK